MLMIRCGKLHEPVICIVPNQTPSGIEKTWCIKSSTSITRHNVNSCIKCPSEVFCLCTHTIVLHPEEEKKNQQNHPNFFASEVNQGLKHVDPSLHMDPSSQMDASSLGPKFTDGCKFTWTQVHTDPSSQIAS